MAPCRRGRSRHADFLQHNLLPTPLGMSPTVWIFAANIIKPKTLQPRLHGVIWGLFWGVTDCGRPPIRNNVDLDNRNTGMTSTVVNAPKEVADVLRTNEWIVIKNTSRQQLDGDHGTVFIGPAVRHQQLYAQAKPMSTGHVVVPGHGTLPFDRVSCPGVKECPECHAILPTKSKVCAAHPKLPLVASPSDEARCEGMRVGKRRHLHGGYFDGGHLTKRFGRSPRAFTRCSQAHFHPPVGRHRAGRHHGCQGAQPPAIAGSSRQQAAPTGPGSHSRPPRAPSYGHHGPAHEYVIRQIQNRRASIVRCGEALH